MKKLIDYFESMSIENKLWTKTGIFFVFALFFAAMCSSCAPVPYMVVQWVTEDEILCRDDKGLERTVEAEQGVYLFAGDTLLHVGGFRYYNINGE